MSQISVAIDGPSGVGKSTISKELAQRFNLTYIDTGAMYRSVALYINENNINADDKENLLSTLNLIEISFGGYGTITILNGKDVSQKIRTKEVTALSSKYSKIPIVRETMLKLQRELATDGNVIMEGRDIGTRVIPHADIKVFLVATSKVRAERRFLELKDKNMLQSQDIISIEKDINNRDLEDSTRSHSPLLKADDAIEINTDNLTIDEVLEEISGLIKERLDK